MADFIEPISCKLRWNLSSVEVRYRKIGEEFAPRDRKTIYFLVWITVLEVASRIVIDDKLLYGWYDLRPSVANTARSSSYSCCLLNSLAIFGIQAAALRCVRVSGTTRSVQTMRWNGIIEWLLTYPRYQ
jgi:hypothetical protein